MSRTKLAALASFVRDIHLEALFAEALKRAVRVLLLCKRRSAELTAANRSPLGEYLGLRFAPHALLARGIELKSFGAGAVEGAMLVLLQSITLLSVELSATFRPLCQNLFLCLAALRVLVEDGRPLALAVELAGLEFGRVRLLSMLGT